MNNVNNLSSLIWSTADDVLRGMFKPSEYGRVILPFVVMRRLDCVLEPKKDEVYEIYQNFKDKLSDPSRVILRRSGFRFFNISKYDLNRLKSDPTNVLMNFNNYVQGYSQNVLDIIQNFTINPLVEKLHRNKRFYQLIDKFTEFDLHPNVIDNHQMGSLYEELLRKFSEISNEESGDHFTPRHVVKLLVSFVFGGDKEDLQGEGNIRSVYDPCCGTGGMLTIGKDWVLENINPNLKLDLYGQELNDVTYAICKSDLLMMDETPENIQGPSSSISDDRHQERRFDYLITNPPFGVSWSSERYFVDEESNDPNGRFSVGTPRSSDGALLFLQHLIHKMKPEGSRIGIVFNGSPLFTGDAGSGESEIRKWIIENDWLECIVSLPDRMFFNTGISTYIWIVTNKKSSERKGKVQLIDGSSFSTSMRKNLGDKGKYINDDQIQTLFDTYQNNQENEFCKIYPNQFFGYTKVKVERPLRQNFKASTERINRLKDEAVFKNLTVSTSKKQETRLKKKVDGGILQEAVLKFLTEMTDDVFKNKIEFESKIDQQAKANQVKLPVSLKKTILKSLAEVDPTAEIVLDENGNSEKDSGLSDSERIPLDQDIDTFHSEEILPHVTDSWIDRTRDIVGYEINFTKYFYQFTPLRSVEDIVQDLKSIDAEISQLSMEVIDE